MKRGIYMNEEFKQILRSLQYAKKYIYHCFKCTPTVLKKTSESIALTDIDKNEIRKIPRLPIWEGWTLTIITLLQSLIIFVPIIDSNVASDKKISAILDDNSTIYVSLKDLRNCLAHNISDNFFSKLSQNQFVFSSRIENDIIDYTVSFDNLVEAMDKLEREIEKVII